MTNHLIQLAEESHDIYLYSLIYKERKIIQILDLICGKKGLSPCPAQTGNLISILNLECSNARLVEFFRNTLLDVH